MRRYLDSKVGKVGVFGFINGLNLLLSGNTLNFWLANYGIDPKIIGFFAIIALPYALKYLIAIFINHFHLQYPQYKIWLISSRLLLALALVAMSYFDPLLDIKLIALTGFFIALLSVVQDIILNANRIAILSNAKQISGTAINNVGYHLGTLFSGAGVIFASVYTSWSNIFMGLAVVYLLLTIWLYFLYQEKITKKAENLVKESKFSWLKMLLCKPFEDGMKLRHFLWVILFVLFYRLSDNMMMIMINPFLIETGFSTEEIAGIYKFFGSIMVIIGGFASGFIIPWLGVKRSLLVFGVAHLLGTLLYLLLSVIGKSVPLLYLIAIYDAITGGMVMTAYLTFISLLCKGRYIAAQYALFSSVMGISRVIFPMLSGVIVDAYGMTNFFVIITLISLSSIIFTAIILKRKYI